MSQEQMTRSEIWDPRKELEEASNDAPEVEVVNDEYFPFLDMEMFWNNECNDELHFKVHMKPNQQLKCLNSDSNHHQPCI